MDVCASILPPIVLALPAQPCATHRLGGSPAQGVPHRSVRRQRSGVFGGQRLTAAGQASLPDRVKSR
jgi:hypothetical protein